MADPLFTEQLSRNRQFFGNDGQDNIENAFVIVVGLGRYRLDSLESDIRSSLKDLADESTVNIISKITAERAVLPHKVKALDEVLKKMESPAYKRKITLAKQKR
mgnify:CR=1 FL=1